MASTSRSRPDKIHGLIGPNGSGKTTTLNVISGYYAAKAGTMTLGADALPPGMPALRAMRGIARTFQTPRVIGEASVLQNVMIGGTVEGRASFLEALLALPRNRAGREDAGGESARIARRRRSRDRWPMCASTGCNTANCASSRSRVR